MSDIGASSKPTILIGVFTFVTVIPLICTLRNIGVRSLLVRQAFYCISNCVFDGTDRGIRIKSTRGRGGVVEDIRVSNVVMSNIKQEAVVLNLKYSKMPVEPKSERTPIFRNVHILLIHWSLCWYAHLSSVLSGKSRNCSMK